MIYLRRLYARIRYWNLAGISFKVWFHHEDGRFYSRISDVQYRCKDGRWCVYNDGCYTYHTGAWIRRCLIEKVVIEMGY